MKKFLNFKSNLPRTRDIKRHLSLNQAFLEYTQKYKDSVFIFSSLLGGLGIFGGMIAYVVGDRVTLKSQLKILKEKLVHVEDKLAHEKELRASEVKLAKANTESEMRGRILDLKYHGDYGNLRDDINKVYYKDPKNSP